MRNNKGYRPKRGKMRIKKRRFIKPGRGGYRL